MNRSQIILAGGAIALVIGSTAALSKTKSEPMTNSAIQANSMLPTQSAVANTPSPPPAAPSLSAPAPAPTQSSAPDYSGYQAHRITTCSGQESNANFRQFPSLSSSAILGAVRHGDLVYLTGRTTSQNGVAWYEAIAPSLFPVPDPGAVNNPQPNQLGWIASCFVSG